MAFTYGFYDSLGGDRKYNANQISAMFDGIISPGILTTIGSSFVVSANPGTMNITVGSGRAWLLSTWSFNDSNLILTVLPSEVVLPRIDTVVIEVDKNLGVRANSIKIIKGTPNSSPVAPTLTATSMLTQYALADIYVAAGVTQIIAGNITNRIGATNGTPFASGLISTIDTSSLLAKFQGDFETWFADLQNELDANQAANLQNQINALETKTNNGWIPLSGSPVFSSADSPTGVVSINVDHTALLSKGMRVSYRQSQALSAFWTFDATSNPQVGSFTMANIGSPTYSAGKFSNALTLNGTNQALSITDVATLKPTGAFTIGVWFKTSATGAQKTIFASYSENTNFAGVHLYISAANILSALIGKNTGTTVADYTLFSGKTTVTDGNWHYAVYTQLNNYGQLYVDGNLESSGYAVTPAYAGTNYIRIGCSNNTGTNINFFNGQIDDLFFINGYALDEKYIYDKYIASTSQGISDITLTKMGIITKIGPYSGGNTLLTIYHGTDFMLANSAITNFMYSVVKAPYGFSIDPAKWSIVYSNNVNLTQATPTALSWYNVGNSITIHIGAWNMHYKCRADMAHAGVASSGIRTTLSAANNSETIPDSTGNSAVTHTSATISNLGAFYTMSFFLSLMVKTTHYLNVLTGASGATTIGIMGAQAATLIRATSAYL
jgi:Concanavalin A-like lectin/glucanases superfamily